MAILNAGVARATGGTIQAAVLLFATGLIASLLLAVTMKAHIPAIQTLARIALPQYAGGVIVGFYILSITFLAPRFGVGNAILFAVTAQLLTSALSPPTALKAQTVTSISPLTAITTPTAHPVRHRPVCWHH